MENVHLERQQQQSLDLGTREATTTNSELLITSPIASSLKQHFDPYAPNQHFPEKNTVKCIAAMENHLSADPVHTDLEPKAKHNNWSQSSIAHCPSLKCIVLLISGA
ncbi:hypothetical protein AVEN_74369-1 [Araneus ventricosus]|uniref:Uncharacterized protein n=1 Tax=Araneus ventricosus TaxID=182803 RepID=A0A4Y2DFC2_ARAVE|nr:hypothetical protein AVEN_74369-1 [Araneus ventricosus]